MVEKAKHVVDIDTGEMLSVVDGANSINNQTDDTIYGLVPVPPHSKTQIVSQEQRKRHKRKMDYEWLIWNTSSARERVRLGFLNDNEDLFICRVVPFTNYRCVPCNDDDNNYYMSIADIIRLLGWSRRRVSETIKSLERKDLLVRVPYGKGKYIMFNPNEFHRGDSDQLAELVDAYKSHREVCCNNKGNTSETLM